MRYNFPLLFICLLFVGTAQAQTPLQYQLNQQGGGNCAGSAVTISITTSAVVTTNAASAILTNTAVSGGYVANDGGRAITQRGVCWSTTSNPTTANSITNNGSGLGTFTSSITGLSPNTLYYVRAYVINSAGTFYGNEVSFTTAVQGSISTLNCGSATNNGNLISGTSAIGVSSSVPYTGGNGGMHNGQSVSSTGVTGLTATLNAGTFANGAGSVTYTITGTPANSGTASFALNIGGQSCTLNLNVVTLASMYPSGSVFCNGPTAIVDVTNPTTGKTWMDRNLGASQAATSSTDANAYGDLYQWGRRSDGHQCRNSTTTSTLSSTDQPVHGNFILSPSTGDWRNPQNNNLWQGINGVNNPCPSGYRIPAISELDVERASWASNNANGAYTSILKLALSGFRNITAGALSSLGTGGHYWSSTVNSAIANSLYIYSNVSGVDNSPRAHGIAVRCIKELVGSIDNIDCGSSSTTGSLYSGLAALNVSVNVPYTGGNGGFYPSQNISSTGVTGLTASVTQGLFASGAGSVTYTITGTPSASGTASFALNIGGQSCTLNLNAVTLASMYPSGSVFCNGPTAIVDVTNPTTGKTWMDRNLGASQAATSSTDANAYGDLYQWGRRSDGHQCRNSLTTNVISSNPQPGHDLFIVGTIGFSMNWLNPDNSFLWFGMNGTNNPCPSGYRIPNDAEWLDEFQSWSSLDRTGAYASILKLPRSGSRNFQSSGSLYGPENGCWTWSNNYTLNTMRALAYDYNGTGSGLNQYAKIGGLSVRCIKN